MPNIPCGFIEGRSQCVPQWCKTGSRGEYVKKGDAEKTELKGESKDLLNEEQGKNVGDIADSVMRLYRAFGMLKEKERGYR